MGLGNLFAVAVHAYAVMSNHVHLVIEVSPSVTQHWSDDEVARRWLSLSSRTLGFKVPEESEVARLAAQTERVEVLRERLGSLSWFMRYLKEPVARAANDEDQCTGRFWEGRFDTQILLDDEGLLSAMTYVDLNPVRAGVASFPEHGPYTSLAERVRRGVQPDLPLRPIASGVHSGVSLLTEGEYLRFVDWSGRSQRSGQSCGINAAIPAVLERLSISPGRWLGQVMATETGFCRAIGSVESLVAHAHATGRRWIRGVNLARCLDST